MSTENKNQTPFELGYRMPAEWESHTATWTAWPFKEDMWFHKLHMVRQEFAQLVKTISQFEPVHLLVRDEEALDSARALLGNSSEIIFHEIPINDIWFRDSGPIFVKKKNDIQFVKWDFNAWGKKFQWDLDNEAAYSVGRFLKMNFFKTNIVMEGGSLDVNGKGIALTTKQCLLSKMRNPNLSKSEIDKALKNYLGIEKCLWLENGLEGDHTDGHIDTIVRFVNENTIVCSRTENRDDVNFKTMEHNYELLKSFENLQGEKFQIVPLVLPKNRMEIDGQRLPCTYANFYIGNGFVIVPQYNDPHDKMALSILSGLFPEHKVIGSPSQHIIIGGGSFHCVTQQQPA
jgi:agmatine deiminase